MKNKDLFYILFCMASLILYTGCEKAEIQRNSSTNDPINLRTDDCDDCPIDDCCCGIELVNSSNGGTFSLCNTSNGIGLCTGGSVGACSPSNNGGQHFTLSPSNLKEGFCVNKGDAFWISQNSGGGIEIKLTCQNDQVGAQILRFTIPSGTPYYFDTDNNCELTACQ